METEKLLHNGPKELIDYLNYCKQLQYEQDPDYNYLISLFKDLVTKTVKENIDYQYDWVNEFQAQNHMKLLGISLENSINSNIITTTDDENMPKIMMNPDKDIIKIKKKESEKINYYDDVIDDIIKIADEGKPKNDDSDSDDKKIIKIYQKKIIKNKKKI